jgi:alpha-glucosidase
MSNWDGKDLVLPLSFLDEGTYRAVIARDGVNADRYAADYTITEQDVNKGTQLPITMAKGGGFVMILKKK